VQQEQREIIRVEDLTVAYNGQVILDHVSFTVAAGEVFVILGGSGSGKSTLFKHMIGLYKPVTGTIFIDGQDFIAAEGEDRLAILRKIGVMYQSSALFGSMTLLENISLPLDEFTALPAEAIKLIALIKLKQVGLESFGNHMPSELSGGMQKSSAMALDPRVLFLDEPSAGLDPITSAELDELILRLAKTLKITFVIVSHELSSIFTIADRVIMLDKQTKGIVATGNPHELRDRSDNPRVRQFFLRRPSSRS
jgi:phospholipid/cholesterol/gamma-HCH transport system ATP-binding protein